MSGVNAEALPCDPREMGNDANEQYYCSRGFSRPVGRGQAGFLSKLTYFWVNPLLQKGAACKIEEHTAEAFVDAPNRGYLQAKQFSAAYTDTQHIEGLRQRHKPRNLLGRTMVKLYRREMFLHAVMLLVEIGVRIASCVILKLFLMWVIGNYASGDAEYPVWKGWAIAAGLGGTGYVMTLLHHQIFWHGMRMGFAMRQQAISAVFAKALRLNSSSIADISAEKIVKMVSNDVWRFDDAKPFWPFLFAGPLELVAKVVLLSVQQGAPAAFAGVAATLLIIPTQMSVMRSRL